MRFPTFRRSEVEVLLHFVRAFLGSGGRSDADRIQVFEIDWEKLFSLATYHRVLPLLCHGLIESKADVPDDVREYCKKHRYTVATHNLVLRTELKRLVRLFDERGIDMFSFKGPLLAEKAYGSLSLRRSGDIDILVRERDFPRMEELITTNGYVPAGGEDVRGAETSWLRGEAQYPYFHESGAWSLDVHTRVMPPGYTKVAEFDALGSRAVRVDVEGTSVPTLGPEQMLLTLCLHGTKERWQELKHAVDVAAFIRAHPELQWDVLLKLSREAGSERVLLLGLTLARRLTGVPLPENVDLEVESQPAVRRLAAPIIFDLYAGRTEFLHPRERLRYFFAVQDSLTGRLRYACYVVTRRLRESL